MREPIDFQKEVLVHVHIPKTGGSTLRRQFVEALGEERVLVLGSNKIAHWRRSYAEEYQWRALYGARRLLGGLTGAHPLAEGASRAQLGQCCVMAGHVALGREPKIGKKPVYVGLVRDPHDRMMSEYYFISERIKRGHTRPNRRSLIHDPRLGAPQSLDELLDRIEQHAIPNWRNAQCRHIHPSATFEAARAVLEATDSVFAPLSRATEFGAAVGHLIGSKIDMNAKRNISTTRSSGREDGEAQRARIARHFEEDQKLYDYIQERWAGLNPPQT